MSHGNVNPLRHSAKKKKKSHSTNAGYALHVLLSVVCVSAELLSVPTRMPFACCEKVGGMTLRHPLVTGA